MYSTSIRLCNCNPLVALVAVFITVFAAPAAADEKPVVLVLGDSLSAGFGMDVDDTWVAMLQARLNRKGYGYRVVNASISGDTTGNGLRRLPRALELHRPEIVIIELGGNDGLRGLPVEIMRENLEAMIVKVREAGALPVLAGIMIPPNYGEEYADAFAAVYPALAAQHDVPLIPFFMDGVALDPSRMQDDGIHPNESAQPILLDNVWEVLWPTIRELGPTSALNRARARYSRG